MVVSNCTTAKAMLACGEIWWAPAGEKGLVTLLTWASGRREATTWLIAASLARIGVDVWKTTSAVSPALAGNRALRRLAACWDWVLPAVNLFWKRVPTTCATTVMPMMARIQSTSTSAAAVVAAAGQAAEGRDLHRRRHVLVTFDVRRRAHRRHLL